MDAVIQAIQAFEEGWKVRHICTAIHHARGCRFELHVGKFLIDEGQVRVWIAKDDEGIQGAIIDDKYFNCLPGSAEEALATQALLVAAIADIDANFLDMY
ncbi:hypothetical protein [Pseudomonas sp. 18175]|uniref:hypothetical protein n=1 Tax=Pseudomonas sp. 18175 TaxID=3390056 RepID=UPI003D1E7C1B